MRGLRPCAGTVAAACLLGLPACGAGHRPSTAAPTPRPAGATPGRAHRRAAPSPRLTAQVVGRLPAPVQLPAVATAGDALLSMGGLDRADASVASIVRVGPRGSRVIGRLPVARHDAAAATLGSTTLFVGGGDAGVGSDAILSVGAGGRARSTGRLPAGASDVEAATIGRTVYVVGGYTGTTALRTIVAVPAGRAARVVARLPRPLRYAAVAAVDGRLLIAGGTSGSAARRDILRFDPSTRRVRRIGQLPRATTHAAGAVLHGRFYVVGGRGDGPRTQRRSVVAVDPSSGATAAGGRLPVGLSDLAAGSFADHVTAVGGRDARGGVHADIVVLRPARAGARRPRRRAPTRVQVPRAGPVPAPLDRRNVYAAEAPDRLSPVVRHDPALVYVPDSRSDRVDVISQRSFRIVRSFAVGSEPQHVTPAWDLRTLWVTSDRGNRLTAIDPRTGRPGARLAVRDPYNLYFTADGRRAIVVAEAHRELDFRTPHTLRLVHRLPVPRCPGVDHMDYTADGRRALVSCEFGGRMIVVDLLRERVTKTIDLRAGAMPQDVKLSPDGRTFYVADMASGGVWLIDARRMATERLQLTGVGAHGLYPSRDARHLYVSNRGEGSITVLSFRSGRPVDTWRLPGGGSPDMGGVSADGRILWLSGRYDGVVYAISTRSGRLLHAIRVGDGPHGLAVWPQPGRYSIGHTGILR